MEKIIREPELLKLVGLSRTSVWRREKAGAFPRRLKLGSGARAIGWLRSDVEAWMEGLKQEANIGVR